MMTSFAGLMKKSPSIFSLSKEQSMDMRPKMGMVVQSVCVRSDNLNRSDKTSTPLIPIDPVHGRRLDLSNALKLVLKY